MPEDLLKFLSPEDWKLISAKLTRLRFERGDEIIAQGSREQFIYLVRQGTAKIDLLVGDRYFEIARVGAGEICGEMSFLEDEGASARVTAEDTLEADVISGVHLYALFSSFPALAARFYQSLAFAISKRLRQRSTQIALLLQDRTIDPGSSVVPRQWEDNSL